MKLRSFFQKNGLGMRTNKTALSVFVCLCIGYLTQAKFPVYACIAAVVTMQDTPEKSFAFGKARLIGTGIGGIIGIIFLWLYSIAPHPLIRILILTFAVVIGLMVCNKANQKEACSICAVVILAIMIGSPQENIYLHALIRVIETALGVIVAVLINRYLFPNIKEEKSEGENNVEMNGTIK